MRPNLVVFAVLSLAATPALAQGVSPADRYGAAAPRPAPMATPAGGPVAAQGAMLTWSGKVQAGLAAGPAQAAPPQLIPGGLLSHSSVVAGQPAPAPVVAAPAPARPQAAAPMAPIAAAPLAPVRAAAAPAPADMARMAAAAPDGLLGVPPPVRNTPAVSGAL